MTQEDKELLLKDLCGRLPYGVRIYTKDGKKDVSFVLRISDLDWIFEDDRIDEMYDYDGWKPYLRPMSSMTEEEEIEYDTLGNHCICTSLGFVHLEAQELINWLNAHHFDFRNLIGKGLAIDCTNLNIY